MHDVIVVGARCAGAATAMLLARAGARVLLLDRATLPSDIPHGHFIHRHGPRRLRDRVFFADAATAVAAGYRPCAVCLPEEYAAWKRARTAEATASPVTTQASPPRRADRSRAGSPPG